MVKVVVEVNSRGNLSSTGKGLHLQHPALPRPWRQLSDFRPVVYLHRQGSPVQLFGGRGQGQTIAKIASLEQSRSTVLQSGWTTQGTGKTKLFCGSEQRAKQDNGLEARFMMSSQSHTNRHRFAVARWRV